MFINNKNGELCISDYKMTGIRLQIDEKDLEEVLDQKMDEIVDFIFTESQQNIVNKKIVDEGSLLKSGQIKRHFLNKEIIYSVPYADSIEFGRIPGIMPPVEPIKGWIRRTKTFFFDDGPGVAMYLKEILY